MVRVFGDSDRGGNPTGVVRRPCADPAATAAALGHPDTAFVQASSHRRVDVRTFSPVEELAQCLQASLAVPVALGAAAGEHWHVRHPAGTLDVSYDHQDGRLLGWIRDTDVAGDPESVHGLPPWCPPGEAVRLPQGRPRLYLRVPDPGIVPVPDPREVLDLCHAYRCTALVLHSVPPPAEGPTAGSAVRARVFTRSLAGHEDVATGGAAAGIGAILSGLGVRGTVTVVQGPAEPERQGRLYLRLGADRHLGGEVTPFGHTPHSPRTTTGAERE